MLETGARKVAKRELNLLKGKIYTLTDILINDAQIEIALR